ncbi:MAG: molecular chaperone HtpG [Clostridia bacterium]|nr:molecular chaperone HtpG [Clostridia bacterium]
MAKKQFKAESKRLLDLMINSIYTHKEIFLRELISNASDALDKLYFQSLTDSGVGMSKEDFCIRITPNEEARTLTISDNGCGMSKEDLENNLGTIAKSGTLSFKQDHANSEDMDVIGQFGVGFYSAFMVSSQVTVISKAYGSDEAFKWESTGADGYTVSECHKDTVGTDVILTLKENTEDENYDRFLKSYTITSLIKKYSDYIRYPIRMMVEKSRPKEDDDKEFETYMEDDTLNSMVPLWKKNRSEVTDEEYNSFYMDKFHDYEEPLLRIHSNAEGMVSYNALLFIPKRPPYDYYSKEYKRGLQLYTSGVMIMDKCEDLLPDYFGFVRGLVDSSDLSLNISREMLQHDRQLKVIALNLKKKIKSELLNLLENDRDKYVAFFEAFGLPLKYGMYAGFGQNKEFLQDLAMFYSASQGKLITLKEYVDAMPEDQKDIYYACAESYERAMKLPQTELVRDKGYDILCMKDDVDEFVVKMLDTFMEKHFRSVSDKDLDVATEEEKESFKKKEEEHVDLLTAIEKSLDGLVKSVRLSNKLKNSPVCLTSDGPLSIEMEKVLNAMPTADGESVKAERVLEINPDHPVFASLSALPEGDARIKDYARLLYDQALLIEGLPIEDPVAFSNSICALMK